MPAKVIANKEVAKSQVVVWITGEESFWQAKPRRLVTFNHAIDMQSERIDHQRG